MTIPTRKPVLIGPKFMLISRGAAVLFAVAFLALLAGTGYLISLSNDLHDQQQQTLRLVDANSRLNTALCKLATGLALYQPNLDTHVLQIVNEVIGELPSRCFPSTSGGGGR